jgi:hypothetical protein
MTTMTTQSLNAAVPQTLFRLRMTTSMELSKTAEAVTIVSLLSTVTLRDALLVCVGYLLARACHRQEKGGEA